MSDERPYTLHLGDCLAGMAAMADRSVDVSIFDPPYDAKTHAGALVQHNGSDEPIDFDCLESMDHVSQALRVSRRWVVMFCALEQLGAYQEAAGDRWVRAGVWVRHSGPQKTGDRPGQAAEGIAIMHAEGAGKMRWNRGGGAGLWEFPIATNKLHPCQKPDALMEKLIRDFTEPGDTVLDAFMGSGATGVAAIRLGRRFVGFEGKARHFATAEKRIGAAREQLGMSFTRRPKPKQAKML